MFDHLAGREELWLDFMADCGDGFNSSYQIARTLAQPTLEVDYDETVEPTGSPGRRRKPKVKRRKVTLPRGDALVIGGDLAYPHPDSRSYEVDWWMRPRSARHESDPRIVCIADAPVAML